MNAKKMRNDFDKSKYIYDGSLLTFRGVRDNDVYNCSIPFIWNGHRYIYGRVEKRDEWASSTAWLFEETGKDEYTVVPGSMVYPLEDPFIAFIHGEIILGGTHVRKSCGKLEEYHGYFYRGTDPSWLTHFTCGPANMKDIRLVELADGKIGVFSRQRGEEVIKKYGSAAVIGFAVIEKIDELNADIIDNAPVISGLFEPGEWGGCNQCYLLKDGRIGVIGHRSYTEKDNSGIEQMVYINISFIFDPQTHSASDIKVIGDKKSYPTTACKVPNLADCAFTSGIIIRDDGKVDLYSGLGDIAEGKITIDSPFGNLY